ncbi:MAG: molybdopterin molybdotransferase MoeA [Desulfurococcales archaeon]|nr:molybdopterin molybdotransferase MoeA [Desulfurococcales archaeon]
MASRSIFKRLAEPREAISLVHQRVGSGIVDRILGQGSIIVGLQELLGRLIAEEVRSPRPLPWYPRSLVDGCAVRSVDVAGAFEDRPVVLRYRGRVKIGVRPSEPLRPGECWEIDTGAWLPLGADAVVPIEYVTRPRHDLARIERGASPGQGIALPATDVATGDQIAWAGAPVTPEMVSALASIGLKRVKATRRVRAAVFSTGDELVEPGEDPGDAGIFDSNRFQLISWFKLLGYDVVDLGIARDTIDDVEDMIIRAVGEDADVIVASGGTSAGLEDVVYKALGRRGEVLIHGLRIKPGKPTILGIVGEDRLFIGLPGNPRSASNVFEEVVLDLLSRLGLPSIRRGMRRVRAQLVSTLPVEKGRHTIIPLALAGSRSGYLAFTVAKDSYMIASYPKADALAVVPAGTHTPPRPGSLVEAELLREPGEKLIMLTDTAMDLVPRGQGLQTIYYPVADPHPILESLKPGTRVVYAEAGQEASIRVIREATRSIVLAGRGGRCERIAVYQPYTIHQDALKDAVKVPSPRAESAVILYKQGYVDCALIPEDYADGLETIETIGSEKLVYGEITHPTT